MLLKEYISSQHYIFCRLVCFNMLPAIPPAFKENGFPCRHYHDQFYSMNEYCVVPLGYDGMTAKDELD